MVFFASILIVLILYFLQGDGIIYAVIVAIVAELINIFMAQTLTKSVEQKAASKYKKILFSYKNKAHALQKSIIEFEKAQEESVKVLYNANKKIKEYEERLDIEGTETKPESEPEKEMTPGKTKKPIPKEKPQGFDDLPSGSNRKRPPI